MTKKKRYFIIFMIMVMLILIYFLSDRKEKDRMVIRVGGWDMEYTVSDRKLTIEDFEKIEIGSSLDEIENKLGEPDGWVGGGILFPVYVLDNKSAVELVFEKETTCEGLVTIYLYKGKVTIQNPLFEDKVRAS